jgi:hypothetical protein
VLGLQSAVCCHYAWAYIKNRAFFPTVMFWALSTLERDKQFTRDTRDTRGEREERPFVTGKGFGVNCFKTSQFSFQIRTQLFPTPKETYHNLEISSTIAQHQRMSK